MGANITAVADFHIGTNRGPWTNLHILADARRGIDDRFVAHRASLFAFGAKDRRFASQLTTHGRLAVELVDAASHRDNFRFKDQLVTRDHRALQTHMIGAYEVIEVAV